MNTTFLNNIPICNAWNWVEKYLDRLTVEEVYIYTKIKCLSRKRNVSAIFMRPPKRCLLPFLILPCKIKKNIATHP
jgi:hypothetical protein